jgi:hypothetical protein
MRSLCTMPECDEPVNGRGLCRTHYMRWHRHGDPSATPRFHRDPAVRFWSRVDVGHPLGCWWWTGKVAGNGYGKFPLGRRVLDGDRREEYAHRFAYESLIGLIPPGMQLDHLCRNRICINPDHLEVVTPRENTRRGGPARKSVCVRGHELVGHNIYFSPSTGRRSCRTCRNTVLHRRYPESQILELRDQLTQPATNPHQDGA